VNMREQFEAWCKSRRMDFQRNARDGTYYGLHVSILWDAWQKSAKAEREECAQACIAEEVPNAHMLDTGTRCYNAGLKSAFRAIRGRNITQGGE